RSISRFPSTPRAACSPATRREPVNTPAGRIHLFPVNTPRGVFTCDGSCTVDRCVAKRHRTTRGSHDHATSATSSRAQTPIESAVERGDISTARRLASATVNSSTATANSSTANVNSGTVPPGDPSKTPPTEQDRAAAERVLERTRPDPVALLAAAAVLVAIFLAAWLALFRAH